MDIFLLIAGLLCMLIGVIGSLLPVLPGLPISYAGLVLLHVSSYGDFTRNFLIVWAALVVVMMIIEYLIPKWGAQKYGGTKTGQRGALLGTIAGIFVFPPLGLIIGPFVGAFIGELIDDSHNRNKAFRSAWGSLMGFLAGSFLKVAVALVMLFYFIREWAV
ncbi:MAG TPA: DUF456 domain-containing protein [Bacteroidetes bacterium]|jgi:uncharacterized protein|nr:MAG: hypothetical protein ABR95_00610 [Sphingobacteriales bacterium BACL12 MAG-120813-bin55]HCK21230.1 DUF456 domain-containing protein [Bacteroidota bacterium]